MGWQHSERAAEGEVSRKSYSDGEKQKFAETVGLSFNRKGGTVKVVCKHLVLLRNSFG